MKGYYRYTEDETRLQMIDSESFPVDPILLYPELKDWETYDDVKLKELYEMLSRVNGIAKIDQSVCIDRVVYTNSNGIVVSRQIPDTILIVVDNRQIGRMTKENLGEFKKQVLDSLDESLDYPILVRYTIDPTEYDETSPGIVLSFIETNEFTVTEERGVRYRTYLVRNSVTGKFLTLFNKRV